MDFPAGFGFDFVTQPCSISKSEINGQYINDNDNDLDHGFHLQDMTHIGSAGLFENLSGQSSSYSQPKTLTDLNPSLSVCSELIAMDHQNWMDMDENSGQFDWDDTDPEIIGSNSAATQVFNSNGGVVLQQPQQRRTSKNLYTERKRRMKLKETLLNLRSVVPKISKMDKQSIVGDAISYVLDLQKKVQEIQDEIKVLSTSNRPDHHTQLTAETIEPLTNADCASSMKNLPDKLVEHGKILDVDICDVGEGGIYHVRIEMKKESGVLVKLTRALESLPLHIINSNICCFDESIVFTLTVNGNLMENPGAAKLEDMIRQTIGGACLGQTKLL